MRLLFCFLSLLFRFEIIVAMEIIKVPNTSIYILLMVRTFSKVGMLSSVKIIS